MGCVARTVLPVAAEPHVEVDLVGAFVDDRRCVQRTVVPALGGDQGVERDPELRCVVGDRDPAARNPNVRVVEGETRSKSL